MSPSILFIDNYRFFFNSREEKRRHIHISTTEGTAKFWLEPIISLAEYYNISDKELKKMAKIVEEHQHEFIEHWNRHFNQ